MSMNMKKRDIQRRCKREQREDYTIPRLIKSPTGSETEDSPPYSSSSRMQRDLGLDTRRRLCNKFKQQQQHQQYHEPRVSNSSILMGAKEIKRQLSCNSNEISSPTRSSRDFRRSIQASKQESISRTLFDSNNNNDDDEQWSSWKSEHDAREKHSGNNNDNDYENNYIYDNDDDDDDDDTLKVLEKAKAIISSRSDSTDKNNDRTNRSSSTIKKKGSPHNYDNENMKNCMVQRVSELDNSTFASSTSNDGYLPTYLISGLACGDDFKSTPCNNRRSQLLNKYNSDNNNTNNKDEAQETSTLDFLANLHVEQEELNLIFNSFEEEQQELFAQSNCRYTSLAANHHISHTVSSRSNKKPSSYTTTSSSDPPPAKIEAPHRVTNAAAPFQKMIAPRSSFYDELLKDPAYQHALKAGTLWQSLCSQHVNFPSLWWDGQEPACPPLGSSKKKEWAYLGRHRVQGDYKLNSLIGNRGSSGRLLLHLVVRDVLSLEPIEDICCGCFHPNARGVRTTPEFNPRSDDCRDVWLGHRRRAQETRVFVQEEDSDTDSDSDSGDEYTWSTIESLLRHQNKNRVDATPLGALGGKSCVSNKNLRAVFGSKPPVYTVFVLESELYELFQNKLDGSIPASVVLLRHYLRY